MGHINVSADYNAELQRTLCSLADILDKKAYPADTWVCWADEISQHGFLLVLDIYKKTALSERRFNSIT